ncbi:MAG: cytochrome b N-terminal domain-containing protein [Bacteroidales bacterium]|nr:cytochrome b N-terminal domain-containing protein [Bacteroidales bacterium]
MSAGISDDNRKRLGRINRNFFLHIHANKVHPHSLKTSYTFGLGVILGFLFMVMILTGVILMMNYTPSIERAYNSVKDIVFVVPGGRYIRNMHRWAAHGMVLVSFLHLIRVFLTGGYLAGRRLNWIIGVCILVVVLFMNFSGYLLPWDQLAFWAVTIGSNIAASFRELTDILGITQVLDIGGFIKKLLIGDAAVGQAALSRFFMLHVIFLPVTLIVLSGVHFWRIRKDGGVSRPMEQTGGQGDNTRGEDKFFSWPVVMWAELSILLLTVASLLVMAFLFDAPLMERANPDFAENPAKSPWYFLGIQELVSYSAFAGGVIIPILFLVFLISIPYIDREDQNLGIWFSGTTGRRLTWQSLVFSSIVTVLLVFILVRFGWFRSWFPDIPQIVIMLINPATLSALFYVLWAVWIKQRTKSSRMSAIALFTCTMTGFIIYTAIGIWFRGPNWEFYWSYSQWPVF